MMTNKIKIYIMHKMRASGYTLQEIGETFNITREAVRQALDKHKLDSTMEKTVKMILTNKGRRLPVERVNN